MSENNNLLTTGDENYSDYYAELAALDKNDIIVVGKCKFCTHPMRIEAEEKWELVKNFSSVVKFFEDYRKNNPNSPKMSTSNVRTHVLHHYIIQEKRIWSKEYQNRLGSFLTKKMNQEQRLDILVHQMDMQLIEIASDPHIDSVRKSDAMCKLSKSITDLMLAQSRLKGDLNSVNLIGEKIKAVWTKMISSQEDPKVRIALLNSLETFQDQINSTVLEYTEINSDSSDETHDS